MRGRVVWALVGAGSVLLISAVASAQCTKDTDCKGDRVCEAGKCTSPVLPAPPPAPPGSAATASEPGAQGTNGAASATSTDARQPVAPAPAPAPESAEAPVAAPPQTVNLKLDAEPNSAPEVAPPLHDDEPQSRRRSTSAMIAGIAMVSVGPIALLGALAAKNGQERCDTNLEQDYPDHRLPPSERYRVDECNAYSVPLYLFGVGGLVLTAAGIPLIVYGAKRLPLNPPRAGLQVQPWASPGSAGVRLRLDL